MEGLSAFLRKALQDRPTTVYVHKMRAATACAVLSVPLKVMRDKGWSGKGNDILGPTIICPTFHCQLDSQKMLALAPHLRLDRTATQASQFHRISGYTRFVVAPGPFDFSISSRRPTLRQCLAPLHRDGDRFSRRSLYKSKRTRSQCRCTCSSSHAVFEEDVFPSETVL